MGWLNVAFHDIWNPNQWYGVVVYAAVFLAGAILLARAIRIGAARMLERDNGLVDRTVVMFLTQFLQIIVYIIALIFFFHIIPALNKLGTALLTGVSVMSVVFGLAAQNTLGNLVAGCTLLLYRPFHIEDLIQVATPTGTEVGIVERLTLGYTMLRTTDDRLVIVPNSLMASQVSLNLNRSSLHSLMILSVGVLDTSHASDVRSEMLDMAKHQPEIHRIISCRSQMMDDGSAMISLRAWCADAPTARETKFKISENLRKIFDAKSIKLLLPELPVPQAQQQQQAAPSVPAAS